MNSTTLNVHTNVTETKRVALDVMYPYVVLVYALLEDSGLRFNNPCMGVLLRQNLVLTTFSCLTVSFHGAIDLELIVIYVRNSQKLKPERVMFYPDSTSRPDLALIVCDPSTVNDFPRLPQKQFNVKDIEYCTLCGFGSEAKILEMEHFTAFRMNRSEIRMCSNDKTKGHVCLHFHNAMPCRGDVGAPLLCDGALHAIFDPPVVAWAPPSCLDSYDATFTLVHPLVPWIQQVNSSLELALPTVLYTPWCWVGFGLTAFTIIVVIYNVIMRFVDWRCDVQETEDSGEDGPKVICVHSSQMSRITNRWLWPNCESAT